MIYLTVTSGDTPTIDIVVTDQDTGATVDLTGATLTWVAQRLRSGDPDITKTIGDGITLGNQTTNTGEASIALDAADTAALSGPLYWELQSVVGTQVVTLAAGRLIVRADLIV